MNTKNDAFKMRRLRIMIKKTKYGEKRPITCAWAPAKPINTQNKPP